MLPPFSLPLRSLLRIVLDPYRRYRHAKLIHAARVSVAILVSILLSAAFNLHHREWTIITCLIVIGGLQHHGNIRKKAAERALGTTIGAVAGLLLIAEQAWIGITPLTYLLLSVACGLCAYYAIGKGGYIALLSAITMVIIAGQGGSALADGLWRTAEVLIGIAIALLFSFALPLYATYSWRYNLADALRGCARAHLRILHGPSSEPTEQSDPTKRLGALLVQCRSLMPSVAKEIDVSTVQLEAVQRSLRICISTLELMWALRAQAQSSPDPALRSAMQAPLAGEALRIEEILVGMARALKFGTLHRLKPMPAPLHASPTASSETAAGYALLTAQLYHEVERMRQLLADTAARWNIGRW